MDVYWVLLSYLLWKPLWNDTNTVGFSIVLSDNECITSWRIIICDIPITLRRWRILWNMVYYGKLVIYKLVSTLLIDYLIIRSVGDCLGYMGSNDVIEFNDWIIVWYFFKLKCHGQNWEVTSLFRHGKQLKVMPNTFSA